jgi:hypothetical protein
MRTKLTVDVPLDMRSYPFLPLYVDADCHVIRTWESTGFCRFETVVRGA